LRVNKQETRLIPHDYYYYYYYYYYYIIIIIIMFMKG
jgi:hypothetical protein